MLPRMLVTLSLVLLAICPPSLAASVTFFNPGSSNEVFRVTASRGMQMAADTHQADVRHVQPELAKQYLAQGEDGMKGMDFRRYSTVHTATVARYDFRLDRLLQRSAK
jgi:hypothetical protein